MFFLCKGVLCNNSEKSSFLCMDSSEKILTSYSERHHIGELVLLV